MISLQSNCFDFYYDLQWSKNISIGSTTNEDVITGRLTKEAAAGEFSKSRTIISRLQLLKNYKLNEEGQN